ncbi:MAG: sn-glycerol-3-phosphate ABC transporter ATP-binding protein UgpC [Planctomycetota bacterium]|nr:sn-glycerol-3-phosphate ABC transporter ATP-binding protein UgpC [Planctomycetota bacterium]
MARVTLKSVDKTYPGGTRAVRGCSLEISDGEFLVLVGPSGCGKSTLLRMIAGLEEITGGTIEIGDRVVNAIAPKDRDIAMVFQNYALYPHKTARANMEFALKLRRVPRAERDRRVGDAARVLGIEELLDRKPGRMSGGQQQRVALGRALVREPAVFLFDEPLSNLDAKLRHQTRGELKELHARVATTSIYVTHDQEEAMTLGDRVVVMKDGVIQQVGPPLEVYRRPANRFVATFIGAPAMNMLEGRVSADGGSFEAAGGGSIALDAPAEPGRQVVVGIRPQHLATADAGIDCRVRVCEPLGDETDVMLDGPGDVSITARLRVDAVPQTDTTLRLAPRPGTVHVFDQGSGERVEAGRTASVG